MNLQRGIEKAHELAGDFDHVDVTWIELIQVLEAMAEDGPKLSTKRYECNYCSDNGCTILVNDCANPPEVCPWKTHNNKRTDCEWKLIEAHAKGE